MRLSFLSIYYGSFNMCSLEQIKSYKVIQKEKVNYLLSLVPTLSTGVIGLIQFGVYPFIPFSMLIKFYASIFPPIWCFFFIFVLYIYILRFLMTMLLGPKFSILHPLLIVAWYFLVMDVPSVIDIFSIDRYLTFYQCLAL